MKTLKQFLEARKGSMYQYDSSHTRPDPKVNVYYLVVSDEDFYLSGKLSESKRRWILKVLGPPSPNNITIGKNVFGIFLTALKWDDLIRQNQTAIRKVVKLFDEKQIRYLYHTDKITEARSKGTGFQYKKNITRKHSIRSPIGFYLDLDAYKKLPSAFQGLLTPLEGSMILAKSDFTNHRITMMKYFFTEDVNEKIILQMIKKLSEMKLTYELLMSV